MATGYGLGSLIQGAEAGIRDVEARRRREEDRAYEKKRREQKLKQGEQAIERGDVGLKADRFSYKRAQTKAERTDEEYQRQKDMQESMDAFDDAMRQFAATGGQVYQPLQDFYNQRFPDDGKLQMSRNEDGTFDVTYQKNGQARTREGLSVDEVGSMAMALRDPQMWAKARAEQAKTESERQHELDTLREKYRLKAGLEQVKAASERGSKRGEVPEYQKRIYKRAKDYYSSLEDGMQMLGGDAKHFASLTAYLGDAIYNTMARPDVNEASLRAMQTVETLGRQARERAREAAPGDIERQDALTVQYLNDAVTEQALSMTGHDAGVSRRGGRGGRSQRRGAASGGATASSRAGAAQPTDKAIEYLKANPSKKETVNGQSRTRREWFDLKYGEGAADRVLGQGEGRREPVGLANPPTLRELKRQSEERARELYYNQMPEHLR